MMLGHTLLALQLLVCGATQAAPQTAFSLVEPSPVTVDLSPSFAVSGPLVAYAGGRAWVLDPTGRRVITVDTDGAMAATWPLPELCRTGLRVPAVAPFSEDLAWLLAPDCRALWLLDGGEWHGPFTTPFAFTTGSAFADGTLVLNTPEERQPFSVLSTEGATLTTFGNHVRPGVPALTRWANSWLLATTGDRVVAVHRYLPRMSLFTRRGRQLWQRVVPVPEVGEIEAAGRPLIDGTVPADLELRVFGFGVQPLDDRQVALLSSSSTLFIVDTESGALSQRPLHGLGDGELRPTGFALAGSLLIADRLGALAFLRQDQPPPALVARVVDSSGVPIGGATVGVESPQRSLEVQTDETGAAVVAGVPRDTVVILTVRAKGFVSRRLTGALAELCSHDVVLLPQPRVCLHVVDAVTRYPITEFSVRLQQFRQSGSAVSIADGPELELSAADGRRCLDAPWPGPFRLSVAASGYATKDLVVVGDDEVEVGLEEEGRLALEVVAKGSEAPVHGAEIELTDPAALERPARSGGRVEVTDSDGRAELGAVSPGEWGVIVRHADFVEQRLRIELQTGRNERRITLDGGARLTVRVIRAGDGTPVSNATVTLSATAGTTAPVGQQATTDDQGRCAFDHLPRGDYRVACTTPDGERVTRRVSLGAETDTAEAILEVGGGASLAGRVIGVDRYPGIVVEIDALGDGHHRLANPVTADGRFEVDELQAGTVTVEAVALGPMPFDRWCLTAEVVSLADGRRTDVELALPPPIAVEGSVRYGERPCSGCRLTWRSLEGGAPTGGFAEATPGGEYRVLLPRGGGYEVRVDGAPDSRRYRRTVVVHGATRIDIDLAGASVKGRVTLSESGEGIEGASVEALNASGYLAASAITGADGGFAIEGLLPGPYEVSAVWRDRSARRQLALAAGEAAELGLSLAPPNAVRLRLVDGASGRALRTAAARLYSAEGWVVRRTSLDLGGDGILSVPVSGSPPFVVVVTAPGYGLATVFGLTVGSEVTVPLFPPATLVLDLPGNLHGRIELRDALGRPIALDLDARPGPLYIAGDVRLGRLPPGRHSVELVSDGGESWQTVTTLVAGAATTVRMP